jgi:primosomal protein N'
MNTLIKEGLSEIEKIKLNIIKEKNNSLFFNTNVVDLFNKLTAELKLETENTGFIIETNILKNDNPEKHVLLRQTIDEFGKGFILPFKQMIKEFDETNNELILNQAVKFYTNEMIPKLKEILSLKYDVSMVEYDESNNIYKLIQLPNSLENNEYYLKGDDKIVKFVKGVKKEKKKTRKDDGELKPKNKTRKIKPVAELVLEDEEEEIIKPSEEIVEEQLESKYAVEANKKPIFDISGNVTWNNEEYDKLWKIIPSRLKELLLQDHDWLEDYMNTCVKLRKDGKQCIIFLPKQAQFPPVKNADGNSLSKSHQDTLLTSYTVKDGVKNYDSLKDTLASILAKEINFKGV